MLVNQFRNLSYRTFQTAVRNYLKEKDVITENEFFQDEHDDSKWQIHKIDTTTDNFTYVNEDINFKRSNTEDFGDFTLENEIINPSNNDIDQKNGIYYNIEINWMQNSDDNQYILISFKYKLKNDIKKEITASEVIEEEFYELYTYSIQNGNWAHLASGKYTGIFMGDASDVIVLEAQDEILIYQKIERMYQYIRKIDFPVGNSCNNDTSNSIILTNWNVSSINIVDMSKINIMTYNYNKILRNFENIRYLSFNVFCEFQYPILENLSDLMVKASVTEDTYHSRDLYEAYFQNIINDIYKNQSCLQMMTLSYSTKYEYIKNCLFWLTDPNAKDPAIFISTLGHTGIFSNEGKLVAIVNENVKKLYIWDVDVLLTRYSKTRTKEFKDITNADLCKMPDPIAIDIDKKHVLIFEKVDNHHESISEIVIMYNDFSMCFWTMNNNTDASGNNKPEIDLIYEVKLPIQQLYCFRYSKNYMICAGMNIKEKKVIYIYDLFQKHFYKKIPYYCDDIENILEIVMIRDNSMIFLREKDHLRKIAYEEKEQIKGLVYTSKKNTLNVLRLSNTGRYLLCRAKLLIMKVMKAYFFFIDLEKDEGTMIFYKNIKEMYFSENDKYIVSITYENELLVVEMENKNEIKASFNLSSYDTSGHFGTLQHTNAMYNGLYCSEEGIVNIVKKESHKIYVLSCNVMKNGLMDNAYKLNFICDINESNDQSERDLCTWHFSTNRENIVFYLAAPHHSTTYVWSCREQRKVNETHFKFSLNSSTLHFDDAFFTNDGSSLIMNNYRDNSLYLATEHTSQKYIDEVLNFKKQFLISQVKHISLYNDKTIIYTKENTKNKTLTLYHVKIDNVPVSDKFVIEDENVIFTIPNYMRFGDHEEILVSSNVHKLGYVNYGMQKDSDHEFILKSMFWNPVSGYYKHLLDYNFMRKMKGERLDGHDIEHILNFHLIDRVDNYGESLLMSAVIDSNVPIIYKVLDWCSEQQFKIRYVKYKDADSTVLMSNSPYEYTDSDLITDDKNIMHMAMSKRNRKILEILSDAIVDNLVYLRDAILVIDHCKDELFSDFRDVYLKLVRCVLVTKDELKFPGSSFEHNGYIAMTLDSPDKPKWDEVLVQNLNPSNSSEQLLLNAIASFNNNFNVDANVDMMIGDESNTSRNEDWEYKIDNKLNTKSKKMKKAELVKDFDKRYKVINCESVVFPWINAVHIGQSGLLQKLQLNELEWQTYDALPIKLLISHKWDTYGRNKNLRAMIIHIVYLAFFQFYAWYLGRPDSIEDDDELHYRLYFTLFVISLIGFWNLWLEFNQSRKMLYKNEEKVTFKGLLVFLYSWSYSKWNIFELFLYLSTSIILPSLHIFNDIEDLTNKSKNDIILYHSGKNIYIIASICCCLIWWKFLYFFQPYRATGPLILMIFEIIKDICFFIFVLLMVLFGFTNTFYVLFNEKYTKGNVEVESFNTYEKSLITTFSMMLGEFDIDCFYSSDMQFLSLFLFVVFMLIVLIILINMLIAIMADSFDRIKAKEEISFLIARAQILEDIDSKLLTSQQNYLNEKMNKKFLHILIPKSGISEQNEWLGKVEEISKNVKNIMKKQSEALERRLGVQNSEFEEKVSDVVDNVARIETNLKVQIKEEFKKLYEKLNIPPRDSNSSSSSSSSSIDDLKQSTNV